MYRSIYFKIILIFVMFMITVMAVVGTVLINSVFNFYTDEFVNQMDRYFEGDLKQELLNTMTGDYFATEQKNILRAYGAFLGIDIYRNYYILDMNGDFIDGSSEELGKKLSKTSNMLVAMDGSDGKTQLLGSNYTDYAVYLKHKDRECIIYIKDTQEEMQQLSWELFSIILQAVLFGLIIAVILSFFLAKAITSPIQSLTQGAQLIASGEFDKDLEVYSNDEIGTLTNTFNHMGHVLKHTLNEISGERQKLETVFSYLTDAVIAFSKNGKVLNINKCACELFVGHFNDDFTIDVMFSLLSVECAQSYLKSLNTRKENSYVIHDVEYNNKIFDINLGVLRYIEKNAAYTGCIVVIHDITERYALDKAQREFVANVSHELRTPLAGIRGAVESILLNPDMSLEFRENFLNMAVSQSERMMGIINDLLTLSRFDNKKTQWQISVFNIKNSLLHICDFMQTETISHGHTINLDVKDDIPDITGDKERIERVLINIISNAIKYSAENGIIDIRAVAVENEIKIHVRDNGIGIPQEDLSRLFERFYRVEKSRTSDTGGTGLGLAIAKEIVEAHGGTISIKSRLNRGTIVSIVLPIKTRLEENE